MCQLNFKSDFLLKNYLSKIENKHEWMCIIFGVMSFRYSVNFQSIYKRKWFVQLHGTEQQAYWAQKVWDDPQCGPGNWKCNYMYQWTLWYILYRGKYSHPPPPHPILYSPLLPSLAAGKFMNGQILIYQIISLQKTVFGRIQEGAKLVVSLKGWKLH